LLKEEKATKFPIIPAAFPGCAAKSADFGQNLQESALRMRKFAAKFAAAGNSPDRRKAQKSTDFNPRAKPGPADGSQID
jgi:hypothetical protein